MTTTLVTEEEYLQALKQEEEARKVVQQYHLEKRLKFEEKLKSNHLWTDDELVYSAQNLCPCGYGLAYPKDCGANHYWDCSAILKGTADLSVKHCDKLPFMFYEIKSESERRGTTRGVFRPKLTYDFKS